MIVFGLLVLGCIGWLTVFCGWWIPTPDIALFAGVGLFIFLLIELTFLRKRNAIALSAVLIYFNAALGCWVYQFWQSHGYAYPLWIMRFLLVVMIMLSAVILLGFSKGKGTGDKNRSRQNNNKTIKSLFERRKKKKAKQEVTIVLGESADNHSNTEA